MRINKEFIAFLKSRIFLINLGSAVLVVAFLLWFVYNRLESYTRHGETIGVPSVIGLKTNAVGSILDSLSLRYEVVDSSVYDIKKERGTVLDQDPAPGEQVKQNRTIYLTVNASSPPRVSVPNLIDVSFRQAQAILESYGLKVGHLIYKPDLAKNAVLGQVRSGRDIPAGTMIPKGSSIDLVLGNGYGDSLLVVPDLSGLSKQEAIEMLNAASLNLGAVVYDPEVTDSLAARVHNQSPAFSESARMHIGESVDIFLK